MTHLDLDALADLLAGEGSPQDVAHVASCAACSEALADLDASLVPVAAALAALAGEPLPALPEGFAERLDVRLAQAAADQDLASDGLRFDRGRPEVLPPALPASGPSAHAAGASGTSSGSPVVPLSRARARRRAVTALGLAAGFLGLAVAGGLGLSVLRPGADGGQDSTAALSAPESYSADDGAGLRSAEELQTAQDSGAVAGGVAAPVLLRTGTDYAPDAATLAGQLPALLRGEVPTSSPDVTSPLASLLQPAAQASCLSGLAATVQAADAQPLLLDQARAYGEPALLVVLPSRVPGSVEVAAVGAECTAGELDLRWSRRVTLPG